jgi:DedD protein
MDQELKQRLIGASVIIALAIIFIPMLFDNEVKKSADKNIDIVIPESGSHPLSVKTFSLDDEPAPNESAEITVPETDYSLADDQLLAEESVDGNGLIESSGQRAESESQSREKTGAINPDETMTETAVQPADEPVNTAVDMNPSDNNQAQTADTSPDTDAEPKTTSEPEPTVTEKQVFRVKLGSFSQAENAQKVKNSLAQKGIDSLVELAPDMALYRVWSQALYQDKAKAEDYVASVKKLNLNIGTPKIIVVTEEEVKASADRGQLGWVVQLGSFAAKNNALDLRNKLKLAGFTAFVDFSENSQGESRYRLRVGPVNTREQADKLKQQISQKLKLDGLVKTHELAQLVD